MLRVTGEGYYYGMTFMDEGGATKSHHLMSCFEFATEGQVDDFYTKITNAFNESWRLEHGHGNRSGHRVADCRGPQPPAH